MKKLLIIVTVLLFLFIPLISAELTNDQIKRDGELFLFDGGDLYTLIPEKTLVDSYAQISLLFYDKEVKDFNPILTEEGDEQTYNISVGNEGNNSYVLFTWNVFIEKNTNLSLKFNFDNQIVLEKEITIEATKREILDKKISEKDIEITNENVSLIPNLREKLSKSGLDLSQEEFYGMMALAKDLDVKKTTKSEVISLEGNITKNMLTTKINISNHSGLEIYVIELIDKKLAENTSTIKFNLKPIILEEDPLIMWHLEEGTNQELEYTIEREGETSEKVTGNTIVLAKTTTEKLKNNSNIKKTIIPLALIPLVAFIIIYFAGINVKGKNKKVKK